MNKKISPFLYSFIIAVFGVFSSLSLQAQTDSLIHISGIDSFIEIQSLIKQGRQLLDSGEVNGARVNAEEAYWVSQRNNNPQGEMDALMLLGKIEFRSGNNTQALYAFWQTIKLKSNLKDKGFSERIYYNMAVTLAAMKKYPLALKYFKKATLLKEKRSIKKGILPKDEDDGEIAMISKELDSLDFEQDTDSLLWSDEPMDLLADKSIVIDADTIYVHNRIEIRKEQKITEAGIMNSFNDGEKGIAYGLIIHTKQPVSGKRKTYSGINTVGHMFITLIKYNKDSKYTSRTFGFYPDKDNFLSATPIIPTSSSTYKDDEEHDWDEIVAKFIPKRTFNRILRMVKKYSKTKYNLNKNNCTDFGLCVAGVAGIQIKDTHGSWPLGSGNNPGFAGQSIRDNKVEDTDQDDLIIIDALKDNLQ